VSEPGVSRAGEIRIHALELMTADLKSKTNILALMLEIDLYEDIFSHIMSGSIYLSDGFSLKSKLPMMGEELLYLEYSSPFNPDKIIKQLFYVCKISDVVSADKFESYHLHFMSIEASRDIGYKISQAYSGKADRIIRDIFRDNFTGHDKPLVVYEPSNSISFVSNFWSPFKAINYATSMSLDNQKNPMPSYLFYEDTEQFNFVSLNTLYSQAPVAEFNYNRADPKREESELGSTRDLNAEYSAIKKMYVDVHADFIQRVMDGIYKSKVYEYDLLRRNLKKNTYSYFDNFDKVSHLETYPMQYENTRNHTGVIDYKITYPYRHASSKEDKAAFILANRPGILGASTMFRLDIVVNGRSDIKVGQVVNVNMIKYETKDDTDLKSLDPYLSGKYLISAIQHRITSSSHEMVMQLYKESYGSKIELNKDKQ
jgi:hypothetical protein